MKEKNEFHIEVTLSAAVSEQGKQATETVPATDGAVPATEELSKSNDFEILNWNDVDISKDYPKYAQDPVLSEQPQQTEKESGASETSAQNVVVEEPVSARPIEVVPVSTEEQQPIESSHEDMEILNWENVDLSKTVPVQAESAASQSEPVPAPGSKLDILDNESDGN